MNRDDIVYIASTIHKVVDPLVATYIDDETTEASTTEVSTENNNIDKTVIGEPKPPAQKETTIMGKTMIKLPNSLRKKDWAYNGSLQNVDITSSGIKVTFPKGGWGASNGVNLKCYLDELPASDLTVKYRVYVPDDFDYVKGGKLPGFALGTDGTGGRNWKSDQGSARLMFRPGGVVTGYLYLMEDVGRYDGEGSPLMRKQGDGFEDIVHHSNGAGLYIWRHDKDPLKLKRGWNYVRVRVRMNSRGKADGRFVVKVNDKKKSFNKIMWTARPDKNKIGAFQLASWMGGGSSSYAPKRDQSLTFKDVELVKRS
jgi:hypothetical protein